MLNILGIDFEEWFHPELIQQSLTTEKKSFEIASFASRKGKLFDDCNK